MDTRMFRTPEAWMIKGFIIVWLGVLWYTVSRGLVSFQAELPLTSDAGHYHNLAASLLQGMYSIDGVTPFFEREPGYSMFLAAIYAVFGVGSYIAVYAAQGILHAVASFVFVRSLSSFVSRRAQLITLAFLFFLPAVFHVLFALTRESVTLDVAMFLAASALMLKNTGLMRYAVTAGLLQGYLILLYAPFLLFPFFLLAVLLLWRVHWKHIALTIFMAAAVVAPWGVRNMIHTDKLCLTGCYRSALQWHVRGEQAEHIRGFEPAMCLWAEYVSRDWSGRSPYCSFNAVWHRKWPAGFVGVPEDAAISHEGQAKILQYFPHYLWFSAFEIVELHLPYVNGWGTGYNILAVATTPVLYLGILLGLLGWRKKEYLLFVAFAGYFTGIFMLTDATPRYLMPVIFCYALASGLGYDRALKRLWRP